jgi:P-type Cu+ transporter
MLVYVPAEAEVGVAMGTGTDVAMQSAGVTLVKSDLAGIARARTLSRATIRNISVSGRCAMSNVRAFVQADAAAAMSFSSASVIAYSLRLRFARL